VEALWVPQAGIVDYGAVARKYAELILTNGGVIETGQKVIAVRKAEKEVIVQTEHREFAGKIFVNCGGLYSDKIARLTGERPDLQILPFRGEFFELKPEKEYLVRNLIYPVPNPNFPFLGV